MKSAAIYKGKKKVIIHSYSKTNTGLSIATSPFFVLDTSVSKSELLDAIKQAVAGSKEDILHPKDWSLFMKDYLQSIGLRNHKDLQKKFSLCTVQLINNNYEIIPSINKGLVAGFIDRIDKKVVVPAESDETTFIEVIEKAFAYCE